MTTQTGDRNSTLGTNNMQHVTGFAAFKAESQLSFVRAYDPKAAKIEGFTHQVLRYRETEKQKKQGIAAKQAQMVTVPSLVFPADWKLPETPASVLMGVFEDAQNDLLKSLIDGEGKKVIEWDDVDLEHVLAFLTATRTSSRMTKESNEAWAKVALAVACEERGNELAENKGVTDPAELQKLQNAVLLTYVQIAGKLSAAVPNVGKAEAEAMVAMLERAGIEDDVSKALSKKLHNILNPAVASGFL